MAAVAVSVATDISTESLTKDLSNTSLTKEMNPAFMVRGTIVRRRKYRDNISLAIRKLDHGLVYIDETTTATTTTTGNGQQQREPPVLVMVPRSDPSMNLEASFLGTLVEIELKPETIPQNTNDTNVEESKDQDQTTNTSKPQHTHRTAQSLRIVRCSPDPNAIQDCLKLVSEGKLPPEIFSCQLENGDTMGLLQDRNQATKIMALRPKDALRRAFVKRISSRIKGETTADGWETTEDDGSITIRPRKRETHIKFRQRKLLEKMEASQKPMDPTFVQGDDETSADCPGTSLPQNSDGAATATDDALTYNLPNPSDPTMMSGRHPKTRREYLHDKKWPQIRWLVKRMAPILEHLREKRKQQQLQESNHTQTTSTKYLEILDVGGGRGDLAVAVAEAFPDVRVTVVDLNESSLEGGRVYYQSRKPLDETDDRVQFVCGDFADYAKTGNDGKPKHFDVVTAWHACGDLSDYALEFAVKETEANANAFVICPCCYTKRYIEEYEPKWIGDYYFQQEQQQCVPCPKMNAAGETANPVNTSSSSSSSSSSNDIRILQRLAEINERPEITHRAMGLINTMRLRSLLALSSQNQHQDRPTFDITLEEYDLSFSSKNLVLVGVKN